MPHPHLDVDASTIIQLSNQIAHESDLEFVGTEHILLAILRHNDGLGAQVLKQFGVNEEKARKIIDEIVQRSMHDTWVFGRLPGSPHYRNVVAAAIEEANQLESKQIGSEHLLLALLREKGSTAQSALKELGVTIQKVRDEVLRRLSTQA